MRIGYDGSAASRAAVRHPGDLFHRRPAVLATVWEPALAVVPVALPGSIGVTSLSADPAPAEAVDGRQREPASVVAAEGAGLARSVGLVAVSHSVSDDVNVAEALIAIAR